MSIFAWIVLGLIAGWIGSKIVNKSGEGFFLDIVLGVVGALVGGFLFKPVRRRGRQRAQPLQPVCRDHRLDRRAGGLSHDLRPQHDLKNSGTTTKD